MKFARRIYRRLAHAFPHEFKLAYGVEMMQLGENYVPEPRPKTDPRAA